MPYPGCDRCGEPNPSPLMVCENCIAKLAEEGASATYAYFHMVRIPRKYFERAWNWHEEEFVRVRTAHEDSDDPSSFIREDLTTLRRRDERVPPRGSWKDRR